MTQAIEKSSENMELSSFIEALSDECISVSEITIMIQNTLWDMLEESYISPENMRKLQLLDTISQVQVDVAHALKSMALNIPDDLTIDRGILANDLILHDVKQRLGVIGKRNHSLDDKPTAGDLDFF